ncbi:hypothetical protein HAX54_043189 [Datura stramonium]|uniref:Uncharacterized protein n=1 Tax=Datura stramonium TaxID=4076 RepID=A0ABS8W2Y3_DATST|nr:hypothetical protein [Datura stramonium]
MAEWQTEAGFNPDLPKGKLASQPFQPCPLWPMHDQHYAVDVEFTCWYCNQAPRSPIMRHVMQSVTRNTQTDEAQAGTYAAIFIEAARESTEVVATGPQLFFLTRGGED